MSRRDLTGKTVVVTGAAGGLGSAIARRFAAEGCRLGLLDIDEAGLATVAGTLDGELAVAAVDVTDYNAVRDAITDVETSIGSTEVLVNNAGLTHRSPFAATEPDVIEKVMRVNYLGSVNVTKAALPSLLDSRGAIGVVTSVAGFAPILGRSGYVGSKHALHGLFGVVRSELSQAGVDVTILAPTFVSTDFSSRALDGDGSITSHPQSRVGGQVTPESVADRLYTALERRKRTVVVGGVGHVSRVMTAVAPGLYERLQSRALRSELNR